LPPRRGAFKNFGMTPAGAVYRCVCGTDIPLREGHNRTLHDLLLGTWVLEQT
jgi:hypothetical protein